MPLCRVPVTLRARKNLRMSGMAGPCASESVPESRSGTKRFESFSIRIKFVSERKGVRVEAEMRTPLNKHLKTGDA